jgi:hypothetical protein
MTWGDLLKMLSQTYYIYQFKYAEDKLSEMPITFYLK